MVISARTISEINRVIVAFEWIWDGVVAQSHRQATAGPGRQSRNGQSS